MAIEISIKPKFKSIKVAFGKSAKPLGVRDDLLELAIIARSSNNQTLLNYFDKLPSLDELKREKLESSLSQSGVSFKKPVDIKQKPTDTTESKAEVSDSTVIRDESTNTKNKSKNKNKQSGE